MLYQPKTVGQHSGGSSVDYGMLRSAPGRRIHWQVAAAHAQPCTRPAGAGLGHLPASQGL